ncbi:MAG: DUF1302 domain-containing protein, partial [Alphaproteobacteria bacterium]|nr:DUF1302 domain-containing protein [Alphaproteobacteria bacterium]
ALDNSASETALMAAQADIDTALAAVATQQAVCGLTHSPSAAALSLGSTCSYSTAGLPTFGVAEIFNYDASINTDDGRLNFDRGDFTSGTFKLTTEFEASYENLTLFARTSAFYDAVLSDDSSFERTGLSSTGTRSAGSDIDLLDFYLDIDLQPLFIRVGRQVINWGEATFFLGGNSVFNPISVPAFRRPGSEIKEAFLPVEAIYASLALPYDLTLEAYYGTWNDYDIDVAGTPFGNSDSFELGSRGNLVTTPDLIDSNGNLVRGRQAGVSYVGSGTFSGSAQINCDLATSNASTQAIGAAINGTFTNVATACLGSSNLQIGNSAGNVEGSRQQQLLTFTTASGETGNFRDTDYLVRGADNEPSEFDTDNYGLALRWYSDTLNSTEFALYYQRYTSRIPYASSRALQPLAGPNVTGIGASSTLRGAGLGGCTLTFLGNGATGAAPGFIRGANFSGLAGGVISPYTLSQPLSAIEVLDPTGVGAARRAFYATQSAGRTTVIESAANSLHARAGASSPGVAALTPLLMGLAEDAADTIPNGTLAEANTLGCISQFAQSAGSGGNLLPTGAATVATRYRTEIVAEYPEDIDVYGFSFNTTAFGWGVQGEVAYRPNMPLQLDTDAVAIAALSASCAWENFNAVADIYYDLQTIATRCGQWDKTFQGYVREQVYAFDLGTTATFTRSHPLVSLLQADLAVLLTELGVLYVPDADHYSNRATYNDPNITPLANQCTSGSDLPLGGVFGLDARTTKDCRPTEVSVGAVIFAQLRYNNVLGTAFALRPQVAINYGVYGRAPSPAAGYREDQWAVNFGLTAIYQTEWTASFGYTLYQGDELYNRNVDRDQVSLSLSYAF